MPKFSRRLALLAAVTVPLALGLPSVGRAEDLMQVYREAQQYDPVLASARASWTSTQERVPQALSGLLPNVGLTGNANYNDGRTTIKADPRSITANSYQNYNYSISAAQPLFRMQNMIAFDQAKQQVAQADYVLALAQQDLMLRVTVAYFDVLLAEVTIELNDAQKAAVSEQLAQAKRNFEVGVATITDTNEAQAKYDSIVAQEIVSRNDLDNKRTALRAIIGRFPKSLKKLGPGFEPTPPAPNTLDVWVERADADNLAVRVAQYNFDVATLEVARARAAHYPTVDLVGSYGNNAGTGSIASDFDISGRSATIGVALNVPIYQGGAVNSRVREALAQQEKFRQDLEIARRNALFNAQIGFSGVNSAVALVKAIEQTVISTQVALESNRLGQEVGVRTNLDVLNVQQSVYSARRDLAQAYFNYLTSTLRLKASVGGLTEADLEELNRRLGG